MRKFFGKIYKQIRRFDNYTNKYLKISNNIELPSIAYTNWGMHLADNKNFKSAIEKLETAMLMHGQNPKPCISLGVIYAKLKKYDKAAEVLLEAIKRDSQNAYAYSVLSSVYVAEDKFDEAEEALKKGLKLAPSDSEIYLNYGIFYAKTQKKQKAIEMFKKSKFYNPANLHTLFLLGVMYFETDKITEAFNEFNQIEKINPQYKKLSYYLALCYQKERNYYAVMEYAQKALDDEPDNPAVYVLLAHTYVTLDRKDEVLDIFRKGEEHNIDDFEFFLSEGIVYTKYNEIQNAKKAVEKALLLHPEDTNALYRMGVCYRKEGDIEKAVEYYNRAIISDPNNAYALGDLGVIKYENGNYNAAIQNFFEAINITSEKNYLYFYIANSYYKMGRHKKSLEFYEKTLEYYPAHTEAMINCTLCLLDMNNTKEALRKIRSAYQIDRNSEKIILIYALTDFKCGIYSDAIEKTDIILSKNPNHQGAKLIKVQTLINLKKPQEAVEILNSLETEVKNSDLFIFLSYLSYKILVEENPSHYNESMLNLYSKKTDNIDYEELNKNGLITYVTKQ